MATLISLTGVELPRQLINFVLFSMPMAVLLPHNLEKYRKQCVAYIKNKG